MNKPLTKLQADFAAEHHNLVFAFLNKNHYTEDDFYDIAVFGYLRAVLLYHEREDIRKYSFSTIAFKRMRYEVLDHFRSESKTSLNMASRPYDEDMYCPLCDDNLLAIPDLCLEEKEERQMRLQRFTPLQQQVINLLEVGYSIFEIARKLHIKPSRVEQAIHAAGAACGQVSKYLAVAA